GVNALDGIGFDNDELIAPDPACPVGNGAHLIAPKRNRGLTGVEHDEIIAQPVHLHIWQRCGGGHLGLYPSAPAARRSIHQAYMEEMRADFQRSPQNGPIAATWAGGALGD